MKKIEIAAFIPARSGSRRLKDKNIKLINGEPLIYWTVKLATKINHFDKIIFSTDSKKYLNILKKALNKNRISKKKIIFELRSKKDADSKTKIFDYIKNVLIKKKYLQETQLIVQLLPTAPLRKIKTIKKILDLSIKSKKNIFTVSKYDFHIQFALEVKGLKWKTLFKNSPLKTGKTRSQDQKIFYKPNPVANCLWIKKIVPNVKTIYDKAIPYITNTLEGKDLDNLEDFKMIKALASGNSNYEKK